MKHLFIWWFIILCYFLGAKSLPLFVFIIIILLTAIVAEMHLRNKK